MGRRSRDVNRRLIYVSGSAILLVALAGGFVLAGAFDPGRPVSSPVARPSSSASATSRTPSPRASAKAVSRSGPFAVGSRMMTFVDRSRAIEPPHTSGEGSIRRVLRTRVWYPATGKASRAVRDGSPDTAAGPFPLVIFAHGFDLFPGAYSRLLVAWARAGYVVAAPIFPLTNPSAPGGPFEPDIVNQPRDVSFVITRLLKADKSARGFLRGLIAGSRVAVTGQSDGGDTAWALGYDTCCRERRVKATIVMSGAEMDVPGGAISPSGPPLLAIQGSADTVNVPSLSLRLYAQARAPKYLLWLRGANHLEPYTTLDAYARMVRRITIAFLDRYVKRSTDARLALGGGSEARRLATFRWCLGDKCARDHA